MSSEMENVDGKGTLQENQECIDSLNSKSSFFAYLDILGFKNLVKGTQYDKLKAIVTDFVNESARAIDVSRGIVTATGQICSRSKLESLSVCIVSDSICLWTRQADSGDKLKNFDRLLQSVKCLLASGLSHGLPLRGVVTHGELILGKILPPNGIPDDFSFAADSVYGRAVVEAYEFEAKMNWSGAILTPNCWREVEKEFAKGHKMLSAAICRPEDLFNHFPYLIWYDVPFKCGRQKAIAVNWNYKPFQVFSEETINGAFSYTRKDNADDSSVNVKARETIDFFKYTNVAIGGIKGLPVPSYALPGLYN